MREQLQESIIDRGEIYPLPAEMEHIDNQQSILFILWKAVARHEES
jgi:hypothetical protein